MKAFYLLTAGLFLFSCESSYQHKFELALNAHIEAEDSLEAASGCKGIFENLKQQDTEELCQAMTEVSTAEFSVCEDTIRAALAANDLKLCTKPIERKLNLLEQERNKGLKLSAYPQHEIQPLINFQLPTEIQYRDLSEGYLATYGGVNDKEVILTFDDGPHPLISPAILKTLKATNTKVHFFVLGEHVQAYPDITRLMGTAGHSVGNHTWDHANMQKLTEAEGLAQVRNTQKIIFDTLGWVDPFFRFPYGNRVAEVEEYLKLNQMANFLWVVDSNDWKKVEDDGKTLRTNLMVINDVMAQLSKRGRGIILFHDVHLRTAELLPELLKRLYEAGYKTVMLQATDVSLRTHPPVLSENR
ncbi:MAG: polysaccharide deacetylase family protein [Pseudobdellovibrio sp.]